MNLSGLSQSDLIMFDKRGVDVSTLAMIKLLAGFF
jgi:hypothetical protein